MEIPVLVEENGGIAAGANAITLYNLGSYGTPQKGGGLFLSPYEILHLTERGKIKPMSKEKKNLSEVELYAMFSKADPDFSDRYMVYKDLRNRGHVINQGPGSTFFFRLYDKGVKIFNASARYYVRPLREGDAIQIKDLDYLLELARSSKKKLVIGLVDALGDVSYLTVDEYKVQSNKENHGFDTFNDFNWRERLKTMQDLAKQEPKAKPKKERVKRNKG